MRKIDSTTLKLMRKFIAPSPESQNNEEAKKAITKPESPAIQKTPKSPAIQKTYEVEVVTPMFGGGVEAGVNDLEKLIRETSIRGMLRFWYRATVGAACTTQENLTPEKLLFAKESEIFGTTDKPSRLKVRVSRIQPGEPESYGSLKSQLGYALFPFAANPTAHTPEREGRRAKFNLTLSYPEEFRQEIEIALWAWFNFGGIGARTRRGCGALFCEDFAPAREGNGVKWSQRFAKTLADSKGFVRSWATLGEAFLYPRFFDPQTAWKNGIAVYKDFRQGVGFARNEGQQEDNHPGRSRWPEPDALRLITGQHFEKRDNEDKLIKEHKPNEETPLAFPRAELGAPIIFHFKDENKRDPRKGDPEDVTLKPTGYERASSPIIVKPLVLDDGKSAVSCVLFLNGPRVKRVDLEQKNVKIKIKIKTREGKEKEKESADVVVKSSATYANSPLGKYSREKGSAFEGFKNFIQKKKGYEAI